MQPLGFKYAIAPWQRPRSAAQPPHFVVLRYAIEHGITLDTSYPYTAKTGTCEPENIKPVATITGYKVRVRYHHLWLHQLDPLSVDCFRLGLPAGAADEQLLGLDERCR